MPDKKISFAQKLIAADVGSSRTESDRDQLFNDLLNREKAFESHVGKVALVSWAMTLGCIVLFSVAAVISRNGGGRAEDVAMMSMIFSVAVGVISLVIGLLTTLCWLFRSRTSSLAMIERRLAALEGLLKKSDH